jgi:hypothetical protein
MVEFKPPQAPKVLVHPRSYSGNGIWSFPENLNSKTHKGFVYLIRDPYMKSFYLGKKKFMGIKDGRPYESDWQNYKSSSKLLKEMLKERPLSDFEFIILETYKTIGTLSYSETWSLCLIEAPTRADFYNKRIEAVSWKVIEPITDRHKDRLKRALAWEKMNG